MQALTDAEWTLSDDDFSLFTKLIYRAAGINLGPTKKGLLVSRLLKRIKTAGVNSFHAYYQMVRNDEEELAQMLTCVSTNTTKFFRENHHFEYLKGKVLKELLKAKAAEKAVRIWSAGCSTGEEPYSIAITLIEAISGGNCETYCPVPYGWDIKLLATDISTRVLDAAESGIYEFDALPEDIPAHIVSKYFQRGSALQEGKVRVKDSVRGLVTFRRFNLKEEVYPFKKAFDIIFCRNVMIYFDDPMKSHVLKQFHRHLAPEGYLFLGHSETMHGAEQFRPVHITTYKKK